MDADGDEVMAAPDENVLPATLKARLASGQYRKGETLSSYSLVPTELACRDMLPYTFGTDRRSDRATQTVLPCCPCGQPRDATAVQVGRTS